MGIQHPHVPSGNKGDEQQSALKYFLCCVMGSILRWVVVGNEGCIPQLHHFLCFADFAVSPPTACVFLMMRFKAKIITTAVRMGILTILTDVVFPFCSTATTIKNRFLLVFLHFCLVKKKKKDSKKAFPVHVYQSASWNISEGVRFFASPPHIYCMWKQIGFPTFLYSMSSTSACSVNLQNTVCILVECQVCLGSQTSS